MPVPTTNRRPIDAEPDLTDPDNPEITSEQFKDAVRMNDYPSVDAALDAAKEKYLARRGRPKLAQTKTMIALRVDQSTLDYYRGTGRGWQTRMNDDLGRLVARRRPKPRQKKKTTRRRARRAAAR
jgi:uncharacterized protein (DUF4415 family)